MSRTTDKSRDLRELAAERRHEALITGAKAGIGGAFSEELDAVIMAWLNDGLADAAWWGMARGVLDFAPVAKARPLIWSVGMHMALSSGVADPIMPKGWKSRLLLGSEYAMLGNTSNLVTRYGRPVIKALVERIKGDKSLMSMLDTARDAEELDE